MQKTTCKNCGSTEIYYTQNFLHYWSVDENGDTDDIFNQCPRGRPVQHCYKCEELLVN